MMRKGVLIVGGLIKPSPGKAKAALRLAPRTVRIGHDQMSDSQERLAGDVARLLQSGRLYS
jgi:hypothetical protein